MEKSEKVIVPYKQLSSEALNGVIDEFILREGTDYGHYEGSLDDKRLHVLRQLETGKAQIVFDTERQSCTLCPL